MNKILQKVSSHLMHKESQSVVRPREREGVGETISSLEMMAGTSGGDATR